MSEQIQDQERAEPLIDTTPIVRPAQHERQKSLEKLYADRPTAHELKERHILLDTDAAPYVSPLCLFSPACVSENQCADCGVNQ